MTNLKLMSDREIYEFQFAHMIDELYVLDEMSDHRWGTIKEQLSKYKFESLERLAEDLRHDLTVAWNHKYALVDGHFIEREQQMRKVA